MSDLNRDMVNRFLSDNPKCRCGFNSESASHYLLHCPRYQAIRARTIGMLDITQTDITTLLNGNLQLSISSNKLIFKAVQDYIMDTVTNIGQMGSQDKVLGRDPRD